jgi:hypothetical protein
MATGYQPGAGIRVSLLACVGTNPPPLYTAAKQRGPYCVLSMARNVEMLRARHLVLWCGGFWLVSARMAGSSLCGA